MHRTIGAATVLLAGLLWITPAIARPSSVFIPLGDTNQIARVNAEDKRIEALYGPVDNTHGVAITPDGKALYAASLLEQVATADPAAERKQGVSESEHAAHHGGKASGVSSTAPRTLSFITRLDAKTGKIERRIDVQRFTHHLTMMPDGGQVIGVQSGAGQIVVIDAHTDKVLRYVPVGPAPNYALVTSDGSRVFVSSAGANAITVLDGRTWRKVASIPVGQEPEHMAFSPDEKVLYVVNVGSNELSLVDTAGLTEIRRVPTGQEPHGLAFNALTGLVLVANKGADSLSVYDPKGELLQSIPLAPQPYHVANGPDPARVWVSSRKEGRVWLVSARTLTTVGELEVPGIGHQLAVAP